MVLDAKFANDADGVSDFANATTFTGRLLDTEYGQYYFRNRYYGSGLGRFGSRDFLSYTDRTLNLYTYVGGHPLNRLDPLGLDWLDTVANFGAGWSDTLTLGATDFVREGLGINDGIHHDSTAYGVGVGAGVVHGAAISFGAGGVVGGSGRLIYGGVRLYDAIDTGLTIVGAGVEIYENGRIGVWTAVELGLLALPGGNRLPSTHAIDNAPVSGIACAVNSMARSGSGRNKCKQPWKDPNAPFGSAPFGNHMHDDVLPGHVQGEHPGAELTFNTGPGQTGPDIVWTPTYDGSPYPGWDIAELKPESSNGWKVFWDQIHSGKPGWKPDGVGLYMYDKFGTIRFVGVY